MTNKEFNEIVEKTINSIRKVLRRKSLEYGKDDRLYNFKRGSEIIRKSPAEVLLGMLNKHLVSVIDLIEGSLENNEEMVEEKIGDTINYLILLKGIFQEERNKVKINIYENCINSIDNNNNDDNDDDDNNVI